MNTDYAAYLGLRLLVLWIIFVAILHFYPRLDIASKDIVAVSGLMIGVISVLDYFYPSVWF